MRLALVTLALTLARGLKYPPDFRVDYTDHASRLHDDLLENYVKAVPPKSIRVPDRHGTIYSFAGTDVRLQIRFFKVRDVNTYQGTLSVKVWMRMYWSDLRLAWNSSEYGGITTVKFHAASFAAPEDSEIWLPDITPYNACLLYTSPSPRDS